jgi:hypothetical protein
MIEEILVLQTIFGLEYMMEQILKDKQRKRQ